MRWKYILIFLFLILPEALIIGDFAGSLWYVRDHATFERTRIHSTNAQYFAVLQRYEIVGCLIGGLPGFLILLSSWRADQRERRQAAAVGDVSEVNNP